MPADLITVAHLSVSSAMCFANPARAGDLTPIDPR
jgi:hypothetical protein